MADSLQYFDASDDMRPLVKRIAVGVDDNLVEQLVANSQQAAIKQFTPKDSAERFSSPESFAQWQAKGRTVHWLLADDNKLAGIIWYGKAESPIELPEPAPDETFAIRIYEGFSGQGLARPFMKKSLQIYASAKMAAGDPFNGIWLQTDVDNPAALASYQKFGYTEVTRDEKRVTMILTPETIQTILNS